MPNNRAAAAALCLLLLSPTFAIVAHAQSDNPNDPLPGILDSLDRIEEQTSDTLVAVGETATELKLSLDTQVQILRDRIGALRRQLFEELERSGALEIPLRVPAGVRLDQRKLRD